MMRMTKAMFKRSAATVGLITLLWILSTLMIPPTSHAAIFFDSDFETCSGFPCDGWGGPNQPGAQQIMSNGGFTGSRYMRHSSNGPGTVDGGNTAKPSIYHYGISLDRVFTRFAIRISSDAQLCGNGNTKLMRLRPEFNNVGYPVAWAMWRYGTYQLVQEGGFDGNWSMSSGITPRYGQWDQVEVEYKFNTPGQSNGEARMWVNGVLRIELTNRQFRGPTTSSLCTGGQDCSSLAKMDFLQVYNQCLIGTIDYDRIAVGDTRIGPTNPKQTSTDSIAPASPQGFQVR